MLLFRLTIERDFMNASKNVVVSIRITCVSTWRLWQLWWLVFIGSEICGDVVALLALAASLPTPLRVTIDCRSDENLSHAPLVRTPELLSSDSLFDINSFCNLIHRAIPQAIEDGKFVLPSDSDQVGYSDAVAPVAVSPPRGFIPSGFPKMRPSRLRTPKFDVPKLKPMLHGVKPPKIGPATSYFTSRYREEESSAERMEKFKKGVQKMLQFVKVLGRIDQYLSERTRIVVDKLTKTFAD